MSLSIKGSTTILFSFGLLSFYLLQLLESTVIPLEIIFEHRAYLPSLFLSLALADLVYWCFQRLNLKRPGLAALIVTVVIAGGWGSIDLPHLIDDNGNRLFQVDLGVERNSLSHVFHDAKGSPFPEKPANPFT